jgi:hypothetical protein
MIGAQTLLIIQVAIDLALICIILYLLFFKRIRDENSFKNYKASLEKTIEESDRSIELMKQAFSNDIARFEDVLRKLEAKEKELRSLLQKTAASPQPVSAPRVPERRESSDLYGKVIALADQGMSHEYIEEATGLPLHEIKLILDIRR